MMKPSQTVIKNLLLAFVLITIGYALGKHQHPPAAVPETKTSVAARPSAEQSQLYLQLYYMHSTFRCSSCNKIEQQTKELLQSKFRRELKSGIIKFSSVDFQEQSRLAQKFHIIASCVVVAQKRGDTVIKFRRLDKVWPLLSDKTAFDNYLSQAITEYLPPHNRSNSHASADNNGEQKNL